MKRIRLVLAAVAMILSACSPAATQSVAESGPSAERGAQLFDQSTLGGQAGCKSCHSVSSSPFGAGPSLAEIGLTAGERVPGLTAEEYLRQSIVDPNAYLVDDYTRGLMPRNYADNLTDDEIDSLVQYMLSLQ